MKMPPKKREKEQDNTKNPKIDQIQADHEMFLQAFEKPTQIYRFLRTRNLISPIFLNRTLTYMRHRMSRNNKTRKGFHVDGMLEKAVSKQQKSLPDNQEGYMTLTFLGFYDKRIEKPQEPVKVETLLLKICHKKRKDVSSPVLEVTMGTSDVPINPSEDYPPPRAPTVSIPNDSFSLSNGHLVKSYVLLLRVYCLPGTGLCNGDVDLEPPSKRRKNQKGQAEEVKLFGAELVVYDKHNRCLLTDGDYELLLQEVQAFKGSPRKHSSWETIGDGKDDGPFEVFAKGPTLKFRLTWAKESPKGLVVRPKPLLSQAAQDSQAAAQKEKADKKLAEPDKTATCIVYQFLYNNNTRQQTEAREDMHCPWCSLNCVTLYSLLKHLKLGHSRFTFIYVPIPDGARIDVAINECYDGSYTGHPHDLISQPPGYAFSRNGPVRRTSVTNILVLGRHRPKPSLSEFLEVEENDFETQRSFVTGHNRLYHHTKTCMPVAPKAVEVDSEGESDPEWLQAKTLMMIDDFTDVNEGEKELMKMWNLHVMKYGYIGDCQIPLACKMFLDAHGKQLLIRNLYRNFVAHMCSLYDFGLIGPAAVYNGIIQLQEYVDSLEVQQSLRESWERQRNHWIIVQSKDAKMEEGSRKFYHSEKQGETLKHVHSFPKSGS